MQVTLVYILHELLPLVDFWFWLRVFVDPRNLTISLQQMHVWYYHLTTTFQLVQPINAEKVTLVNLYFV